jgi:hypothetical protein
MCRIHGSRYIIMINNIINRKEIFKKGFNFFETIKKIEKKSDYKSQ